MTETPLLDRAVRRLARDCPRRALAALLRAEESLSLALGLALARAREQADPTHALFLRLQRLEAGLAALREENDILRQRLAREAPRHRRHHTPTLRFRIVRLLRSEVLSLTEAAGRFLVSPQTIARWLHEATARPDRETIGSLIQPVPPLRRYADVVRHLVQRLDAQGLGGKDMIAATLARAAWRLSPRTVGRIRKEPPVPGPEPQPPAHPGRAVGARYPNHVWMADLTEVPGLFRLFLFKLAVVLDVFSRLPLAAEVFHQEPTSKDLAALVVRAAATHGCPRHFVSDQGSQFTAQPFRECLRRLGTRQRYGAVGQTGSIAIVERLWRTLKSLLDLRAWSPLSEEDLRQRLGPVLVYYAYVRPHQALRGAVPAERYYGIPPTQACAGPPPRGRPGEGPVDPPFHLTHLDPVRRRLPLLIPQAA